MQGPFWRMISSLCPWSRFSASIYGNTFLGLLGAFLLLSPVDARADTYYITFYNVTFSAPCIGGGSTCTEVINGSGFYDPINDVATNLSINMTGTLTASFVYGTPPQCNAPGCLAPNVLYDQDALAGFNPIEFNPAIPKQSFNAPTPQPLPLNGTLLFVPGGCGGYQPNCGHTGVFPGNGMTDYTLTSGTYTSIDVSTPEPDSAILLITGMLGLLSQRSFRKIR